MKMEKEIKLDNVTEDNKDVCVICGKNTNVDIDTPIELRHTYIDCAGQLCADCYREMSV